MATMTFSAWLITKPAMPWSRWHWACGCPRRNLPEDHSGATDVEPADHLPIEDRIALCVGGMNATDMFNAPMHDLAIFGDHAQARAAHLEGALSTVRQPWWRRLSRLSHWKSSFVGNGRWPGNALKTVIRRANKEDRAAAQMT